MSNRHELMTIRPTSLDGLVVVETKIFKDDRGSFSELYKASVFEALGLPSRFLQDNVSVSARGVIRGLHFQIPPKAQGKLVTCMSGSIFDVAVDLRPESKTYGKWEGVELQASSGLMLYIPEGFAHGFQALEDQTRVFYKCTDVYSPEHERGVRFDDPSLGIAWPIQPQNLEASLSPKDLKLPLLRDLKV